MNHCPVCNTDFDDTVLFCKNDGHKFEVASSELAINEPCPLSALISAQSPLELKRAVQIAISICDAAEELRRNGHVVGFLRPEDVLVQGQDNKQVKILLPEIAGVPSASESRLREFASYIAPEVAQQEAGRAGYLSPEPAQGESADIRSAVYCIGAILYEMIAGRPPFIASTPAAVIIKQLLEYPRPLRDLRPDLPKLVEAVILRALEKSRERRQQSALQLAQELKNALYESGIEMKVLGTNIPQSTFSPPSSPYSGYGSVSPERSPIAYPSQSAGALSPDLVQTGAQDLFINQVSKGLFQNTPRSLLIGLPILAVLGFIILSFTFTLSATEGDSEANYLPWLFVAILLAMGISVAIYLLVRRRKPSAPAAYVPPPAPQQQPSPPPAPERLSITLGQPRIPQQDTTPTVKVSPLEKTVAEAKTEPISEKRSPSYYDLQPVSTGKQCPECGEGYPATKKYCHNDGQRLIDVKKDKPEEMEPVLIGQYKCFARLGEGGMGIVYKAQHIHLDRLSAVKVLLPQIATMLPNAVQMFRREARLASSINHPNSVIIYDYGEVGTSLFYLAMEFIHGKSLAEIITPKDQPSHPLSLSLALEITKQICDALDTAHQLGIVHRDLKPQNVMVCKKANGKDLVKVLDFGIARSLHGKGDFQTTPGTIMGTPAYMSPEQANGLPDLDARSDIFSLGLILYEMLSGKLPFQTSGLTPVQQVLKRASLAIPPPALSTFARDLTIPASVDQVLMRALEPNRDRRTQSIKEFVDDLDTAIH